MRYRGIQDVQGYAEVCIGVCKGTQWFIEVGLSFFSHPFACRQASSLPSFPAILSSFLLLLFKVHPNNATTRNTF